MGRDAGEEVPGDADGQHRRVVAVDDGAGRGVPWPTEAGDPGDHGRGGPVCADHGHGGRQEFVVDVAGVLRARGDDDGDRAVGRVAGGFTRAVPGQRHPGVDVAGRQRQPGSDDGVRDARVGGDEGVPGFRQRDGGAGAEDARVWQLVQQWRRQQGEDGRIMVYTTRRERVDRLAAGIDCKGIDSKMDTTGGKKRRLQKWKAGGRLMVGTKGLGLGMEVADVRLVLQGGMP